ncbi:MAG TPA: hypothetical protein VF616_21370 [Duganella sp.]|uniref:hypothetical protein n=1 Tax=Duganella sp. TaxID=1904440 RepID=UPI002ED4E1A5
MSGAKYDAALSLALARPQGGNVEVSVRLRSPLTADEVTAFQRLGFADADTRRRVLFGALPPDALGGLAKLDKVAQLSLVQKMAPNIQKL